MVRRYDGQYMEEHDTFHVYNDPPISVETLAVLDGLMINCLGTLIYNLGPTTPAISLEDIICQNDFELEAGEPVMPGTFEILAVLGERIVEHDVPESAPIEARWFNWGHDQIECSEPDRQLLIACAEAIVHKQQAAASKEELELLNTSWPEAMAILEAVLGMYVGEEDFMNAADEADRQQYLLHPMQRRFQQLVYGFDPDEEDIA
jgi:hypothetical protein